MSRSVHGIELTAAGRAFLDHARLALTQAEAAAEAARRAAQPVKPTFAMGFLTGQEVDWLPRATSILRDELLNIEIRVSSDHSTSAPVGSPWMWTLAFGHHEDRTPTHGYEPTREAAMAAFAKSWRRE